MAKIVGILLLFFFVFMTPELPAKENKVQSVIRSSGRFSSAIFLLSFFFLLLSFFTCPSTCSSLIYVPLLFAIAVPIVGELFSIRLAEQNVHFFCPILCVCVYICVCFFVSIYLVYYYCHYCYF